MKILYLVAGLLAAAPVLAQQPSPYAGQQHREIKALSPEQIERYLSGEGMGLAKSAELNGYPGPKHVLELADSLELTPEQRERTRAIFDRMQVEAVRLGRQIVEKERALDEAFAGSDIERASLEGRLRELGKLEAELRLVHLAAHLEQRAVMTDVQVHAYRESRGYDRGPGTHGQGHDGH